MAIYIEQTIQTLQERCKQHRDNKSNRGFIWKKK
jgi:hypothetical protein